MRKPLPAAARIWPVTARIWPVTARTKLVNV
jgi:hypothetical protein